MKINAIRNVSFGKVANPNDKNDILVTGASGYIGSHTAKYLLENGFDVVAVDDYSLGNLEASKELKKIAQENGRSYRSRYSTCYRR